jgi:hypothetical protein
MLTCNVLKHRFHPQYLEVKSANKSYLAPTIASCGTIKSSLAGTFSVDLPLTLQIVPIVQAGFTVSKLASPTIGERF